MNKKLLDFVKPFYWWDLTGNKEKLLVLYFDQEAGIEGIRNCYFPSLASCDYVWISYGKKKIYFIEKTDLLTQLEYASITKNKVLKQLIKKAQCQLSPKQILNIKKQEMQREFEKKVRDSLLIFFFLPQYFQIYCEKARRFYKGKVFIIAFYENLKKQSFKSTDILKNMAKVHLEKYFQTDLETNLNSTFKPFGVSIKVLPFEELGRYLQSSDT